MTSALVAIAVFLAIALVAFVVMALSPREPENILPSPEGGKPYRIRSPKGTRRVEVGLMPNGKWYGYVYRESEGTVLDRRDFPTYAHADRAVRDAVQFEALMSGWGL